MFSQTPPCLPPTLLLASLLLPALGPSLACSASLGVSQGGSQDNRFARRLIEEGQIPHREAFRAEGIFSEHDLPFTHGPECEALLCPRSAVARHQPLEGGDPQLLVQVGFTTAQGAESFARRPLNLAFAIDVSGSMRGEPLQAVRAALRTIAGQLDERDRVSLVAFDHDAELRLGPTPMDPAGRDKLREAIGELSTGGGTNIEEGLGLAYAQVAPSAGDPDIEDRVMLVTDAQPNVRSTDVDAFVGMVRQQALADVGTSVFGVGLRLGAELAQEMAAVRGGNYFYLADPAAIQAVLGEEFEHIVNPVAYDFVASVRAEDRWELAEVYGAPFDEAGSELTLGASTLFLSARSGGIGVSLRPTAGEALPESAQSLGSFDLRYLPVGANDPVRGSAELLWTGAPPYHASFVAADDLGVFKMAALLDEYIALRAGAEYCEATRDQEEAALLVDAAALRLEELATTLDDDLLRRDAAMMVDLADNIRSDGPCSGSEAG